METNVDQYKIEDEDFESEEEDKEEEKNENICPKCFGCGCNYCLMLER